MMRAPMGIAALLLVAGARPAAAQFEDLVRGGQLTGQQAGRPITLDLRAVAAEDAAAKVGEAAGLTLRCDKSLAKQKLTLVVRDRPAREVLDCLATALQARLNREGDTLILVPQEPMGGVTSPEAVAALRLALLRAGAPSPEQGREAGAHFPGLLTAGQQAMLQAHEDLPVTSLTPEQRRCLAIRLSARASSTLRGLSYQISEAAGVLKQLEQATIRLELPEAGTPDAAEVLLVRWSGGTLGFPVSGREAQ